jgi:hypothetical protein
MNEFDKHVTRKLFIAHERYRDARNAYHRAPSKTTALAYSRALSALILWQERAGVEAVLAGNLKAFLIGVQCELSNYRTRAAEADYNQHVKTLQAKAN